MRDDPALHAAAFAYLSDYWINFAACIAHVPTRTEAEAKLYVASLNHAIWFHRPLRADQWLLFDCQSPSGGFGRGLSVGRIYAQSGELVASATSGMPAGAGGLTRGEHERDGSRLRPQAQFRADHAAL